MLEILTSSSVLILVLAILRLVLRGKISARLQYALWLLVLVRLLVPVSFFHSPVSVTEAISPATERARAYSLQTGALPTDALNESVTLSLHRLGVHPEWSEHIDGSSQEKQFYSVRQVGHLVWYAGSTVMAIWFLFVNIRLVRRLKKSRTPYDCPSVLPVYTAGGIPSPCLFGLLRPAVYLTEQAASDPAQARQILTHELTHYRHGDLLWALLRSVCLAVWWFNPLVWLAAALSRQDAELACDEGTIRALGEAARFDYGRTLVGMAKVGATPSDLLCGATTMTTGKKSLKERVARIANAPKMSAAVAVIVLLIAAVAVGCTYGGAAKDGPEVSPEIAVEVPASASDTDAEQFSGEMSDLYGPIMTYFMEYINEGVAAQDAETWAQYVYFGSDEKRALDMQDYRPVASAFVAEDQKLSDDLRAFKVGYQDLPGDEVYYAVQFCGRYDGRLYVFRNENSLPDELRGSLDGLMLTTEPNERIMVNDQAYWEEVQQELASFADPADIRVFVRDGFDEAIPEDSIFGPMTLEDYIFGTDGWKFEYNSESPALEPDAQIIVYDADGRELWIEADMNALMLHEADGSITRVTYQSDPVDCTDMIRHLLPWARGQYIYGPTFSSITKEGVEISSYMGAPGTTIDLDCEFAPMNYEYRSIEWTSSDETVARVDGEGHVTLLSPGHCTITVWIDNLAAICEIYVESASGGSGSSRPQGQSVGGNSSSPSNNAARTNDTDAPAATPPAGETGSVVVRDMRDVYMNFDVPADVDMPSTVPDSPPPQTSSATDGE